MKVMDVLKAIADSGLSLDREIKFCKKSEHDSKGENDKDILEVDASIEDYILFVIAD